MMKHYYVPNASSLATHIALEWVDAEYESIRANFFDDILYSVNPLGTAGTLDCGNGLMITQVSAALKYIAATNPNTSIGDQGKLQNTVELDRWLSFLGSDVHHAFHLLFNPARYAIENNDTAREAALKLCYRNVNVIEKHLDGKDYLMGDRQTILDAYLFPMIRWTYIQFPENRRNYTNINALHDRMLADPGVVKAMEREDIVDAIKR